MRPEQREASYLWDMLEAARTVLEVTQDLTLSRPRQVCS